METKESQFEHFVETNKGIIFRVCYMFSKDKVDADDLFQEILIRLWEGFDTFIHKSKESTWVYQVALNTAININKREQRRIKTVPLTGDFDLYDETDASSQQIQLLYKRINKLETIDRCIILLWLEGISYEEIGAIIGITSNNVGVRLNRIKEKLTNNK